MPVTQEVRRIALKSKGIKRTMTGMGMLAAGLLLSTGAAHAQGSSGGGVRLPQFDSAVYGVLAFVFFTSIVAIIYGFALSRQVMRLSPGSEAMQRVGAAKIGRAHV